MALCYKFVELSTVTGETLEHVVNHWVAQGWALDGIRFVVAEHNRRPAMAFVSFTCEVAVSGDAGDTGDAGDAPGPPPHVIAADDNDVE